jgi:hypothetical protein
MGECWRLVVAIEFGLLGKGWGEGNLLGRQRIVPPLIARRRVNAARMIHPADLLRRTENDLLPAQCDDAGSR